MKKTQKNPPVPDKAAAFRAFYHDRECARVARGDISPEAIGKLEAREQIARHREQMAALERAYTT